MTEQIGIRTTYPSLFKRDSVGKIREWYIVYESSDNYARYAAVSGIKGGAMKQDAWTQPTVKNAGRANETTIWDQAISEINSEYTKKKKLGYTPNIDEVDSQTFQQCMLAKDYQEHKHKLAGLVWVQPKLDGIRCIASKNGLLSRKGEKIVSCPHIERALKPLFEKHPDLVLDGELYNHEFKDNFNKIASLVNKKKEVNPEALQVIQYHVYDLVDSTKSMQDRYGALHVLYDFPIREIVKLVPTTPVPTTSVHELDDLHGTYVECGYEGTMIRTNAPYQHKRSDALLKRKDFQDAEFTIIDVIEGIGNRSNMAGALLLQMPEGPVFKANIVGGFEYYKHLWDNRAEQSGRQATVKFFHLTPDGIPRFPVVKHIHDKE